ncbi:MAG TPA: peptidoglycan glycosyltransferase, partial [Lachnospiraceae bacterium]|nr:peptidoglycan glycosyltransferase [Lachnospiraceae bacterium]
MSLQKESRTRQKKASTTESISAKRKKKTIFPYKVVSVLSVFLFITLAVYMAYFQIYKSEELLNSPYNKREEAQQAKVRRGSVFDRNGNVLAYTETDENGAETRIYPYGRIFAHTVGYLVYGS